MLKPSTRKDTFFGISASPRQEQKKPGPQTGGAQGVILGDDVLTLIARNRPGVRKVDGSSRGKNARGQTLTPRIDR